MPDKRSQVVCPCNGSEDAWTYSEPLLSPDGGHEVTSTVLNFHFWITKAARTRTHRHGLTAVKVDVRQKNKCLTFLKERRQTGLAELPLLTVTELSL